MLVEQPKAESTLHERQPSSQPSSMPTRPPTAGPDNEFVEEGVFPQMSDLEFTHFRVKLPKPVNAPWRGPLFNSRTFTAKALKLTAVDVLATWIRKAVYEGKAEIAAPLSMDPHEVIRRH